MDRLPEMIKELKKGVDECQQSLSYHEGLKGEDGAQSPAMREKESALQSEFNEAIGRLTRAESIFKNSEEIMSFWELRLEDDFEDLLEDSKRVSEGGASTWAIRKYGAGIGEEE